MSTQQVTYEATISPDEDGQITCLVYKSVHAGICGPHGETIVKNLPAAERWLKENGYSVGSWTFRNCYDGLRLTAELQR